MGWLGPGDCPGLTWGRVSNPPPYGARHAVIQSEDWLREEAMTSGGRQQPDFVYKKGEIQQGPKMNKRLFLSVVRLSRASLGILGVVLLAGLVLLLVTDFGYIWLHPSDPTPPTPPTPTIPYTPAPLAGNIRWQVDRAIRVELSRFPTVISKEWRFHQFGHQLLLDVTVERETSKPEVQRLADALASAIKSVVDSRDH